MATTFEVRFQQWIRAVAQNTSRCTSRRYRNKAGRLPGRSDFVQRERPRQRASVAGMGIEGPSSSLARHAAAHALSRRRRRLAKQGKYGRRLLLRRDDL